MNFNLFANVTPDHFSMDPCPHLYVEDALPKDIYDELAETYPEDHIIDGRPLEELAVTRWKVQDLDNDVLTPLWQEFIQYLLSRQYHLDVCNALMPGIEKFYPEHKDMIMSWNTVTRNVGLDEKNNIPLDFQFVLNGLVEYPDGTPQFVHLDNVKQLWVLLLYMRKPEDTSIGQGDFTLHRLINESYEVHGKGRKIMDEDVKTMKYAPYRENAFVCQLNTPYSIHSVTPRLDASVVRRYINTTAHVPFSLFPLRKAAG